MRIWLRKYACGSLFIVMLSPANAFGQSSSDLPTLVRASQTAVVLLRSYDASGKPIGLGSGFVLDDRRVITNAHVLNGAARVEIYDYNDRILGTVDYAHSYSSRVDLAVLPPLTRAPGALTLAAKEPTVGESIVVFGAPQGLANTVSNGIVSGFRERGGIRWMQITAPISQGSSGGPVMNMAGEVVGISVAMLRDGQNLNFAIPVSDAHALVDSPPGHLAFPTQATADNAPVHSSSALPSDNSASGREILERLPVTPLEELVLGKLGGGSLELSTGLLVEMHSITGMRGDVFTVVVYSEEFDANLTFFGLNAGGALEMFDTDDDGAGGTNPMLVIRLDRNGPVGLAVSSHEAGETGSYYLMVAPGDRSAEIRLASAASDTGTDVRWIEAGYTLNRQTYVDRHTLRHLATGNLEAWIRTDFLDVQGDSWGSYDITKSLWEFDCRGRRSRIRRAEYYLQHEHQHSLSPSIAPWASWIPESIGEFNGMTVCGLSDNR